MTEEIDGIPNPASSETFTARRPLNIVTWKNVGDAPPREWILSDWLPVGTVSSLYGWVGQGKSRLALQLAAAVAADRTGLP